MGIARRSLRCRRPGRFGALEFDAGKVVDFREKPAGDGGQINGGFFVADPSVLDLVDGPETVWEAGPLERLARGGELMGYRHDGFWQPMDTLRDKIYLDELWKTRQRAVEALVSAAWRGRRVLVTGHTGFKGSWLSLWLHALGAEVTGFALAAAERAEPVRGGADRRARPPCRGRHPRS